MTFLRIHSCNSLLRKILLVIVAIAMISGCAKEKDAYKDMSAEQIYNKGKKATLKSNYSDAIKDFDALEARYPYGEYTDRGQLALISAYANNEDGAEALAAADRFIRMHPRHPNVDFAYYMKGVVNYNENFSWAFRNLPLDRAKRTPTFAQDSFDAFKTLLEKFPNSRYAADARKRMIVMREQLAEHDLFIAEYYQGQGADLAAANRAAYILNQYPRTEAAEEALEIMQQAYTNMGMKDQANGAKQMLAENFPES